MILGNFESWYVNDVCSDGREAVQGLSRHGNSDSAADQAANRWGRSGGNPNRYRPNGLPKKYWKQKSSQIISASRIFFFFFCSKIAWLNFA